MKKYLYLTSLILLMASCYKKLDFDQAKQLEITPIFEGDMFYMDLNKDSFTDSTGDIKNILIDTIDFGIFKDGKVRDAFLKAEIFVKYRNSFQRNFTTIVSYINEQNNQVDADTLYILPATTTQNIEGEEIYTYDKVLNQNFTDFRKIVLKVEITPTTQPIEDKNLHIQTKGVFYTKYLIK